MRAGSPTRSSPKPLAASRRAAATASGRSAADSTTRIPLPPPPAAAFTSTGKPIALPMARASSSGVTAPSEPGTTGTIFYAKAQLAADLDVTLRRYAKVDPTFPNYSTARLFLRDDQFKSLVALGRAAGARLTAIVGDALPPEPSEPGGQTRRSIRP